MTRDHKYGAIGPAMGHNEPCLRNVDAPLLGGCDVRHTLQDVVCVGELARAALGQSGGAHVVSDADADVLGVVQDSLEVPGEW